MNRGDLDRLIEAVLYEGYILYPYRRSIKNVQRWTFGGIYPPSYREVREGNEACWKETECLVFGDERTMLGVTLRFLHLVDRQIGQAAGPVHPETAVEQIPFEPVAALQVGPREFHPWQEAIEREVILPTTSLGELSAQASIVELAFPAHRQVEPIRDADGRIVGASIREQQAVAGSIEARAVRLRESLFKISVTIANESTLEPEARIQPRRGGAALVRVGQRGADRLPGGIRVADRPAGHLERGGVLVPQQFALAGAGGSAAGSQHPAVRTDHFVRLSADRA